MGEVGLRADSQNEPDARKRKLDALARRAQATEAFAWIKEPFADRRHAARKPATREIEALRLGVLALIEELRGYDPAMRTAVSGVTGKATPLTADKERV